MLENEIYPLDELYFINEDFNTLNVAPNRMDALLGRIFFGIIFHITKAKSVVSFRYAFDLPRFLFPKTNAEFSRKIKIYKPLFARLK